MRDGLGFLPGSACPHWDDEELRRPVYRRLIDEEGFPAGYAADSGVGLHFVGTELVEVLSDDPSEAAATASSRAPRRGSSRGSSSASGRAGPARPLRALQPERPQQVGGGRAHLADQVRGAQRRIGLQRPRRERRRLERGRRSPASGPVLERRPDQRGPLGQAPDGRRQLGGRFGSSSTALTADRARTRVLRTASSSCSAATAYSASRLRSCQ